MYRFQCKKDILLLTHIQNKKDWNVAKEQAIATSLAAY